MVRQKISCEFKDKHSLYIAYMPFIKQGGLFVETEQDLDFNDIVQLEILLLEEKQPRIIRGKVIWKVFSGAQSAFRVGVGVQFEGEEAKEINDLIREHLTRVADSGVGKFYSGS
jgi:type IV pilus assembly protein PilZ